MSMYAFAAKRHKRNGDASHASVTNSLSYASSNLSSFNFSSSELSFEYSKFAQPFVGEEKLYDIVEKYLLGDGIIGAQLRKYLSYDESSECSFSEAESDWDECSQVDVPILELRGKKNSFASDTKQSINDESTRISPQIPRVFEANSSGNADSVIANLIQKAADTTNDSDTIVDNTSVVNTTPLAIPLSKHTNRIRSNDSPQPPTHPKFSYNVRQGQNLPKKVVKAAANLRDRLDVIGTHAQNKIKKYSSLQSVHINDENRGERPDIGLLDGYDDDTTEHRDSFVNYDTNMINEVEQPSELRDNVEETIDAAEYLSSLPDSPSQILKDPRKLENALMQRLAKLDKLLGPTNLDFMAATTNVVSSPRNHQRIPILGKKKASKLNTEKLLMEVFLKEEILERKAAEKSVAHVFPFLRQNTMETKSNDTVSVSSNKSNGSSIISRDKTLHSRVTVCTDINTCPPVAVEENEIIFSSPRFDENIEIATDNNDLWDNQSLWELWTPVISPKAVEVVESTIPKIEDVVKERNSGTELFNTEDLQQISKAGTELFIEQNVRGLSKACTELFTVQDEGFSDNILHKEISDEYIDSVTSTSAEIECSQGNFNISKLKDLEKSSSCCASVATVTETETATKKEAMFSLGSSLVAKPSTENRPDTFSMTSSWNQSSYDGKLQRSEASTVSVTKLVLSRLRKCTLLREKLMTQHQSDDGIVDENSNPVRVPSVLVEISQLDERTNVGTCMEVNDVDEESIIDHVVTCTSIDSAISSSSEQNLLISTNSQEVELFSMLECQKQSNVLGKLDHVDHDCVQNSSSIPENSNLSEIASIGTEKAKNLQPVRQVDTKSETQLMRHGCDISTNPALEQFDMKNYNTPQIYLHSASQNDPTPSIDPRNSTDSFLKVKDENGLEFAVERQLTLERSTNNLALKHDNIHLASNYWYMGGTKTNTFTLKPFSVTKLASYMRNRNNRQVKGIQSKDKVQDSEEIGAQFVKVSVLPASPDEDSVDKTSVYCQSSIETELDRVENEANTTSKKLRLPFLTKHAGRKKALTSVERITKQSSRFRKNSFGQDKCFLEGTDSEVSRVSIVRKTMDKKENLVEKRIYFSVPPNNSILASDSSKDTRNILEDPLLNANEYVEVINTCTEQGQLIKREPSATSNNMVAGDCQSFSVQTTTSYRGAQTEDGTKKTEVTASEFFESTYTELEHSTNASDLQSLVTKNTASEIYVNTEIEQSTTASEFQTLAQTLATATNTTTASHANDDRTKLCSPTSQTTDVRDSMSKSTGISSSFKSSFKKIFLKRGPFDDTLRHRRVNERTNRVVFKEDLLDSFQDLDAATNVAVTPITSQTQQRYNTTVSAAAEKSIECVVGAQPFEANDEDESVVATRAEKILRALTAYSAIRKQHTPKKSMVNRRRNLESMAETTYKCHGLSCSPKKSSKGPAIKATESVVSSDSKLSESHLFDSQSKRSHKSNTTTSSRRSSSISRETRLTYEEQILARRLAADLKILTKIEKKRRKIGDKAAESKIKNLEQSIELLKAIKHSMKSSDKEQQSKQKGYCTKASAKKLDQYKEKPSDFLSLSELLGLYCTDENVQRSS